MWVRVYTDIRNDIKIKKLTYSQRWLWIVILTLAKESPRPGWLLIAEKMPVKTQDLADESGLSLEAVRETLKVLKNLKMVEEKRKVLHVINWDKRQFNSDSSTKRVRKHRALQKRYGNGDETLHETGLERDSNAPETETETETETDKRDAIQFLKDIQKFTNKPPCKNIQVGTPEYKGTMISINNLIEDHGYNDVLKMAEDIYNEDGSWTIFQFEWMIPKRLKDNPKPQPTWHEDYTSKDHSECDGCGDENTRVVSVEDKWLCRECLKLLEKREGA